MSVRVCAMHCKREDESWREQTYFFLYFIQRIDPVRVCVRYICFMSYYYVWESHTQHRNTHNVHSTHREKRQDTQSEYHNWYVFNNNTIMLFFVCSSFFFIPCLYLKRWCVLCCIHYCSN